MRNRVRAPFTLFNIVTNFIDAKDGTISKDVAVEHLRSIAVSIDAKCSDVSLVLVDFRSSDGLMLSSLYPNSFMPFLL